MFCRNPSWLVPACPDMCVKRPPTVGTGENACQPMGDLGLLLDQVTSKSRDQIDEHCSRRTCTACPTCYRTANKLEFIMTFVLPRSVLFLYKMEWLASSNA